MSVRSLALLAWLLPACSEYEFNKALDAQPGDGLDTAVELPDEVVDCNNYVPTHPSAPAIDEDCLNDPEPGVFTPVVEWQWNSNPVHAGYAQIMATPAIANLTDDNGDGTIDTDDVPDIVFSAFTGSSYSSAGTLVAISGDTGETLWSLYDIGGHNVYGSGGVAIGDLDADGSPEVCTPGVSASVVCVHADGSLAWAAGSEIYYVGAPAIADLDNDGFAEVVFGRLVFDHLGNLLAQGTAGVGGRYMSVPIDANADGDLEILAGDTLYDGDMSVIWQDGLGDGIPAVGDFDVDPAPEFVRTANSEVVLTDTDGTVIWRASVPGGGGGAPTVADYDGDGQPEVGVAGLSYYSMFDTDGSLVWSNPTEDDSSSVTGSAVFDFEGDGAAEVVYADEHNLFVYDGSTGEVRMQLTGHASGTLFEYPLIADVDGDGSTEIIVASNNYAWSGWNGITVIGDEGSTWAPARPVWNQFAYHITNINSDGSVPTEQEPNWMSWNNFRAGGSELGPAHWLADLAIGVPDICTAECGDGVVHLWLPVQNQGLLDAPEVQLRLVDESGSSPRLVLEEALGPIPAGSALLAGPYVLDEADWGSGSLRATVRGASAAADCDNDNNERSLGAWPCP